MIQLIKRLKISYSIYNFFRRGLLSHNKELFRMWGIKKKYYSSLSSKDFRDLPNRMSANSKTNSRDLPACKLFSSLSSSNKESLLSFEENGFVVISNYLSSRRVDEVNTEIKSLLANRKVHFGYGNKIMFAIRPSRVLRDIGNEKHLKEILSALLGGNAILFQSINFLTGSEQATHSDSIHMTTYPLGGLLGAWIALEDITEENGPLHYYPGSHKLPYYLNSDYNNEGNALLLGNKSYADYEKMISEKIEEQKLEKVKFLAKKGDLLIWHANLFHGGEPHLNKQMTRKSMVFHYFKEGAICYHEITQRPALIRKTI